MPNTLTDSSNSRTKYEMNLPWFESPFFESLLKESNLDPETKELVKQFAENGYVIIDPEVDGFDVKADQLIEQLKEEYGGKRDERIQDAWRYNPTVKEFALAPKALKLLEVLYRARPIPFQTLNFRRGTEQATHSDTLHFQSVPNRFMAGVWFALEDIDANNGPLHYYPKSHKLPCYDLHDITLTADGTNDLYVEYEKFVKTLMKETGFQRVELNMKKGQALIWAANLFHGGSPIREKGRTRHSQVTHYYFEGCRYYTPMYSNLFLGQIHWRQITDIRTGEIAPHYYNAEKAAIPLQQRLDQLIRQKIKNRLIHLPIVRKLKTMVKGE